MKRLIFLIMLFNLSQFSINAQTVTKSFTGTISGASCPGIGIQYEVSRPPGFTSCQINWTASGGEIPGAKNQPTVIVVWNDTPGAIGTVTATFSNCTGNEGNNGKTASFSELILSIKNQPWGQYVNTVNVNFCIPQPVILSVPEMVVPGTGNGGVPRVEVTYLWTLPSGWKDQFTDKGGDVGTSTRFITIVPTVCAEPGIVTVKGTLIGSGPFCNQAAASSTASISLNAAPPVISVVPQAGYTGSTACNTTPVTFYAQVSQLSNCSITGYQWTYPNWEFVSQSGNSITLKPKGLPSDASPISASVSFGCGSSRSGSYTPPFNQPAIVGNDYLEIPRKVTTFFRGKLTTKS